MAVLPRIVPADAVIGKGAARAADRKGEPIRTAVKQRDTGNVVNLMDALRKSLSTVGKSGAQAAKGRKPKQAASGQREMLMAIAGKGEGKSATKAKPADKEAKRPARQRKAS